MEGISNEKLLDKLEEIVRLEAEIKSQEKKYNLLLEAQEPLEILKEIRIKIILKVKLKLHMNRYSTDNDDGLVNKLVRQLKI